MTMGANRNPYSFLQALIKKQEWNLNKLSGEINIAVNSVAQLKSSVTEIESDIANKTKKFQLQQSAGEILEPDSMQRTRKYIEYKSSYLEQKIIDRNKAEEIVDQLTGEYEQHKNKLQIMHEMLNKRESELMMNQLRDLMLEMDDLWAQREYAS